MHARSADISLVPCDPGAEEKGNSETSSIRNWCGSLAIAGSLAESHPDELIRTEYNTLVATHIAHLFSGTVEQTPLEALAPSLGQVDFSNRDTVISFDVRGVNTPYSESALQIIMTADGRLLEGTRLNPMVGFSGEPCSLIEIHRLTQPRININKDTGRFDNSLDTLFLPLGELRKKERDDAVKLNEKRQLEGKKAREFQDIDHETQLLSVLTTLGYPALPREYVYAQSKRYPNVRFAVSLVRWRVGGRPKSVQGLGLY